jgi:hypothetical protein
MILPDPVFMPRLMKTGEIINGSVSLSFVKARNPKSGTSLKIKTIGGMKKVSVKF